MLNNWLLIIISSWIMARNNAVLCLEVLIYKRLQIWHHNYVTSRNKYLISALSESTVPDVYSLQFLFKSTHHSWRYERKCKRMFFSEQSVVNPLLANIRHNPHHVLCNSYVLPDKTDHTYNLRSRSHSFSLTVKNDSRNYVNRMLFKDIY